MRLPGPPTPAKPRMISFVLQRMGSNTDDANDRIAKECRDIGRKYFTEGNYEEAIKQYTRAIQYSPKDASLYTNRALCQQKVRCVCQPPTSTALCCVVPTPPPPCNPPPSF